MPSSKTRTCKHDHAKNWKLYIFNVNPLAETIHKCVPRCLCHSKESFYFRVPLVKYVYEFYMANISQVSAAHNCLFCTLYHQVVSFICIAERACYFQKLLDQLLDRDPYSEEQGGQGLRVSVHEVCYAHTVHVAQPIISPPLQTFIVYRLISSSVRRFSLFLASVLHDFVGKTWEQTKYTRMQCFYTHTNISHFYTPLYSKQSMRATLANKEITNALSQIRILCLLASRTRGLS